MKVLVIGTGIAGVSAALMAAKQGDSVIMVTKETHMTESASFLAQGGITYRGEADNVDLFLEDVCNAGDGLCLDGVVRWVFEEGLDLMKSFLVDEMKVPFARKEGRLCRTREAAHRVSRILFSHDDTGKVIMKALIDSLPLYKNLEVKTHTMAVELITLPHHALHPLSVYEQVRCLGAYVMNTLTGQVTKIFADKVILAAGGIGNLYERSTSHAYGTGDGIALGKRAGARVINMEFTQFHPTTLAIKGRHSFLLSEAMRGEGALIVNDRDEDVVRKYHPEGSLASRDVVSRAMMQELFHTGSEHLYLSLRPCKHPDTLRKRFPTVYRECLKHKIDFTREPIPITPAFHYSCGGILTDMDAETTVKNLFAVGENACTGVHGANRLASMSLLEGVIFAHQAVKKKVKEGVYTDIQSQIADWTIPEEASPVDPLWVRQQWSHVRSLMWHYVGILRRRDRLKQALHELQHQYNLVDTVYYRSLLTPPLIELRNGLQTAITITLSALKNARSRGCHYLIEGD